MVKKVVSAAVALALLFSLSFSCFAAAEESGSPITLDGMSLGVSSYSRDGTVYLPLRAVCQGLGYTVGWQAAADARMITVSKGEKSVLLNLTSDEITCDEHTFSMSGGYAGSGCVTKDNQTFIQADLLSELFGISVSNDKAGATAIITKAQNPIVVTTMQIHSEDKHLKTDVQYPQIRGASGGVSYASVNEAIRKAAVNAVNEGLVNSFDLIPAAEMYPDMPSQCQTYFNYRIKYNQNGLLSVILLDYQYMGGAHGSTVQSTLTFDLNSGKELKLSDLFSGTGYTDVVDSGIRTQIGERVAAGNLMELPGIEFKTVGENPAFYLSSNGLVFYFQEYEHFPYAAGIQEFPIAYDTMRDYLKSDYGFLVQN